MSQKSVITMEKQAATKAPEFGSEEYPEDRMNKGQEPESAHVSAFVIASAAKR